MLTNLPLIRSHERIDFKRCPKKWYWKWRKGYVPKAISFGPLDLGMWMHAAFDTWYETGYKRAAAPLSHLFVAEAEAAIFVAANNGAPEYILEKAEELTELGALMADEYQRHYEDDKDVYVIGAEIPLEFSISDEHGAIVARHMLKPDLVFRDRLTKQIWLMEHKTAKEFNNTEHLAIDDQARPYGAMAERALKNAGVIGKNEKLSGILYNFLRKAIPDNRQTNEKGQALNKDGSVSKRQPSPLFLRKAVTLTSKAKAVSLKRIQTDTTIITELTKRIRSKAIAPTLIPKTPHKSCSRFCQFFDMCVAEENGIDVTTMQRQMFARQNPYDYGESTEEPISFEMG